MASAFFTKTFEDRQERRSPGLAEPFEDGAYCRLRPERHHELVLGETSRPVEKVPSREAVKRVEEARERDQLAGPASWCASVPQLVEGRDGPRRQERHRRAHRDSPGPREVEVQRIVPRSTGRSSR